jgi:hypothetical protein
MDGSSGRRPLRRLTQPVVEADALLEGAVAFADEARFVDADGGQRAADRRESAFADADDADFLRFHQCDLHGALSTGTQLLGKKAGGQPAGGAAADDQNILRHDLVTFSYRFVSVEQPVQRMENAEDTTRYNF